MKNLFTTLEKLQCDGTGYCAVVKFGDKVFFTDICWKGGFIAEIYEFVETPEETGLGDIECRLSTWATAEETFEDNGHALAWCFEQIKK